MKAVYLIVLPAILMTSTGSLYAHGVQHHILEGGIGVEVHQEVHAADEAEIPLAGAHVEIFGPGYTAAPFQTGETDVHGIFMFNPDTVGIWTLKFLDETGHGKVVDLTVNDLKLVELEEPANEKSWRDIFSGLGYILFIFSLWIILKKK